MNSVENERLITLVTFRPWIKIVTITTLVCRELWYSYSTVWSELYIVYSTVALVVIISTIVCRVVYYNVSLTPQVQSCVNNSWALHCRSVGHRPQLGRQWNKCVKHFLQWDSSLPLTYPTLDSGLTYTYSYGKFLLPTNELEDWPCYTNWVVWHLCIVSRVGAGVDISTERQCVSFAHKLAVNWLYCMIRSQPISSPSGFCWPCCSLSFIEFAFNWFVWSRAGFAVRTCQVYTSNRRLLAEVCHSWHVRAVLLLKSEGWVTDYVSLGGLAPS